MTITCPNCGQQSTGRFCSNCAAPLTGGACPACDAPLTPGARFCHVCGTPLGARSRRSTSWAWPAGLLGAALIFAVVGYLAGRSSDSSTGGSGSIRAGGANASTATTDISAMSPRERADRLFDRIMFAHEQGDTAQVAFFLEMGLQAYALLGSLDADARYHVGLIHAISGNASAALAQADSIDLASPGHLLAAMLRHGVYTAQGNQVAAQEAYARFLESYDREIAASRSEYDAHSTAIATFRDEAARAAGSASNR